MSKFDFKANDFIVYPAHGVGKVLGIEKETIGGQEVELIVVRFDSERMTLRVPTFKIPTSGLRKISSEAVIDDALKVLHGKRRIKRIMWSRRAQEYEAKISSGDPIQIAEVVRDLHRNTEQSEQSFLSGRFTKMHWRALPVRSLRCAAVMKPRPTRRSWRSCARPPRKPPRKPLRKPKAVRPQNKVRHG